MTCLLDDPDNEVRAALSHALAELPDPPRHLVIALAGDAVEVSIPVLGASAALLDGELIHHLTTGTAAQQEAIAGRPRLSRGVAAALAERAERSACLLMLTNPAAHIGEAAFFTLAERFGDVDDIRRCMLARPDIGMRARTRLIETYAASLRPEGRMAEDRRHAEIDDNAEKAIITYAAHVGDRENRELVQALISRERLTTAFLLRAICMGNLTLICHALSVLSGQSAERVERVLKDLRGHTFHAIYSKAEMPASAERVFFSAIGAWCRHLSRNAGTDPQRLSYLVTREVLAGYEGDRDSVVDELLLLLRRICTDSARESARSTMSELVLRHETTRALAAPEPAPDPAPDPAEAEDDLSPEELVSFAAHLADELAELALRDEYCLGKAVEAVEPANQQVFEGVVEPCVEPPVKLPVEPVAPPRRSASLLNFPVEIPEVAAA